MKIILPAYAKISLLLTAVVLTLFLLVQGSTVLIPLVFAMLFSVLLLPVAKLLEGRLKMSRGPASFIAAFLLLLVLTGLVYLFIVQLIGFSEDIPLLQKRVTGLLAHLQAWIFDRYHINSARQMEYLNQSASGVLGSMANSIGAIFLQLSGFIIWTIFVIIYTFFILYYRRLLLRFAIRLFGAQHQEKVNHVATESQAVVYSYIQGLLVEMLFLAIVNCIVFSLLGIKYVLLLGILTAMMNVVPYLGFYSAMAIVLLLTYANNGPATMLQAGIALMLIHFADANILMPRIVSKSVRINPLITIIAVFIGNIVWGIAGMFLFIPLTAMAKIISQHIAGLKPWAMLIGTEEK
jgi:predicted PurR-regulated permease PerM